MYEGGAGNQQQQDWFPFLPPGDMPKKVETDNPWDALTNANITAASSMFGFTPEVVEAPKPTWNTDSILGLYRQLHEGQRRGGKGGWR